MRLTRHFKANSAFVARKQPPPLVLHCLLPRPHSGGACIDCRTRAFYLQPQQSTQWARMLSATTLMTLKTRKHWHYNRTIECRSRTCKAKKVLFPVNLAVKIDTLNVQISRMNIQLEAKDARIKCLEEKVQVLEDESDCAEQYSRRPNLRVSGIPEVAGVKDADDKILAMLNGKIELTHPLQKNDLERSHRLAKKQQTRAPIEIDRSSSGS